MDRDKAFELKLQLKMQDLKSLDSLIVLGFGALGFGALNHPEMLDGSDSTMNLAMFSAMALTGIVVAVRNNKKKVILKQLDLAARRV